MKYNIIIVIAIFLALLTLACEKEEAENTKGIVTFSISEISEVEGATIPLNINLGIDNHFHQGGEVTIDIVGAEYGVDYTSSLGSANSQLVIAAGSLIEKFTIQPVDDELIESDKSLTITLSSASGSLELGEKNVINLTILDDDEPTISMVSFERDTIIIEENSEDFQPVLLAFDKTSTSGGVIKLSAVGGVFGEDYEIENATSESFTIEVAPNTSSATFNIRAIDNGIFEEDKDITLTITEVSGGLQIGSKPETHLVIKNDDSPSQPTVNFSLANSTTVDESAGQMTITLEFSEPLISESSLLLSANTSGTATYGLDFDLDGSLIPELPILISSGESQVSVTLNIVDDTEVEDLETIDLDIAVVSGELIVGFENPTWAISIEDNDEEQGGDFSYLETFEGFDLSETYLKDVLGYTTLLNGQTIDETRVISLINNEGNFADENDPTASSNNGLNLFYNSAEDPINFGVIDNVIITPLLEGIGEIELNVDVAYAFRPQNSGQAFIYFSDTYDGSAAFNESEWTLLGTETASDLNDEGFGNNSYKRESYEMTTTNNFYIAIRVNQTIDADNYRTRWRFDNIRATLK